jgi:hypothetical protein
LQRARPDLNIQVLATPVNIGRQYKRSWKNDLSSGR